MRPILIIGGGGLLLWYLNSKGYFTSHPTTTTPGTTTPGATTTPNPTTTVNPNSLSAIFTRLVANAQAPSSGLTPHEWNYSLALVQPSIVPPDPGPLFPDTSVKMSAAQYWAVMGPALTAQFGLSGVRGIRGMGAAPGRAIGWA